MAYATTWNDRAREAASIPARLALGAAMVYHGTSKLRGEGPGRAWAVATGLAETFAGVAAVLGIATRPAALAVLVTQAMAVAKVHKPKGYDIMHGGMEYNLALMAIAAGLLIGGPGRVSAHEALEHAVEGRGARRLWRRARRPRLSRAIRLVR